MAKKRKYPSDTEHGIRPINHIEKLPVCELSDQEICKLFFARFDADALVMAYVDKEGVQGFYGRLRKEAGYQQAYRRLLTVLEQTQITFDVDEV